MPSRSLASCQRIIMLKLYLMQDPTTLTTGKANGYISGQIFYDAFYVSIFPSPPVQCITSLSPCSNCRVSSHNLLLRYRGKRVDVICLMLSLQARYGNGTGAIVLMGIPMIALFLCGCSSVTSNSRSGRPCSISAIAIGRQSTPSVQQPHGL